VEIHQVLPTSSDISFDLELGGTQIFFAPVLTIDASGELSWPSVPTGFVLQVTDNFTAPVQWQAADIAGRTELNGRFKLTVPLTGPTRFYRLARP
jgi:hypothetical protein